MRKVAVALVSLLGVGLLLLVGVVVFAKRYSVPSSAMEPTLRCARPNPGCTGDEEDRVVVLRFWGPVEPERGDLVAFETPPAAAAKCGEGGTFLVDEHMLKRIVGLPGEAVVERDGAFVVDGRKLDEPWVEEERRSTGTGSWNVPLGHYFVAGDNRVASCDSRVWGPVPRESLIGEVAAVYWPPDRMGFR